MDVADPADPADIGHTGERAFDNGRDALLLIKRRNDYLKLHRNHSPIKSTITRHAQWRRRVTAATLLLLTCVLATPVLRGDGVGYYAYLRSSVIDHDLNFENEYRRADPVFRRTFFDEHGHVRRYQRTDTGLVRNQWGVGAAILWSPGFLVVHAALHGAHAVGINAPATDGYSLPYRWAVAASTSLASVAGLVIATVAYLRYRPLNQRRRRLAIFGSFLAAAAGSYPIYGFFLPFWSLALTMLPLGILMLRNSERHRRPVLSPLVDGLLAGLAFIIHPMAAPWILMPLLRTLVDDRAPLRRISRAALLVLGWGIAYTPQALARNIVYGSAFSSGYDVGLRLGDPNILRPLISTDHGLLLWTPIVGIGVAGLVHLSLRRRSRFAVSLLLIFVLTIYLVGSLGFYEASSYGNRYFLPTLPALAFGSAHVLQGAAQSRRRIIFLPVVGIALLLWNVGLMFQWGWGMIPKRGPVDFGRAAANQFTAVPGEASHAVRLFFTDRQAFVRKVSAADNANLRTGSDGRGLRTGEPSRAQSAVVRGAG